MTTKLTPLSERSAWKALGAHYEKIHDTTLRQLFADDPARGERLNLEAAGIFLDYSKNRVTDETLKLLVQLAEESGLRARIAALATGERASWSPFSFRSNSRRPGVFAGRHHLSRPSRAP